MAKKGGQQQLQTELNTDEDLELFLTRSGLVLIDVYSEWCGPCLGLVGPLKKLKFEFAGESLQLAVAKSDTITAFKRFHRKSEPTWLFFVNGRAVNIAFGANVPKLIKLIMTELNLLNAKGRKTFAPDEMLPVEEEKFLAIENARIAAEKKLAEENAQKRKDYLISVTDQIMENMPDIGITLFGTQVNRDMLKQVMAPADQFKIQCKDRKFTTITKEQFETINFASSNPLPQDVQEIYYDTEGLVCFWKLPEGTTFSVFKEYLKELTKPREQKDPDTDQMKKIPPILKQVKIKLFIELQEGEEWEEEPDVDSEEKEETKEGAEHKSEEDEMVEEEEEEEEEHGQDQQPQPDAPPPAPDAGAADDDESVEEQVAEELEPVIRYKTKIVRMPPMWIPHDARTHAALIYVLFRAQTAPFLPPDPVPDPPHIIMAFEASYKKRDLIAFAKRNKASIPYFGFFTSDDPNEAKLISASLEKYEKSPNRSHNDRVILRVNKVTSHMMLNLVSYNPTYVSPNVDIGFEETKLFFPEDFKTESQELLESAEQKKEEEKSGKGKKKRKSEAAAAPATPQPSEPTAETSETGQGGSAGEPGEGGEGAPTSEAGPTSEVGPTSEGEPGESGGVADTTTDVPPSEG